jgi:cytochrome d ubiquinol oxidase subunit II
MNVDLPLVFAILMGAAVLLYVVLDGYDLGVGMLMPAATPEEQERMVASIGPFWDANETWLVLGVGILLVAFPLAHGEIMNALYLPVAVMLIGLMLRGVAFEFPKAGIARCGMRCFGLARSWLRLRRASCSDVISPGSTRASCTTFLRC